MTDAAAPVTAEDLAALRTRTSEKWTAYPEDVLPLFVAETDYPLAPAIAQTLIERVKASDTGYIGSPRPLGEAFAGFAAQRWGWRLDPQLVRCTTDVSVAIVESLRVVAEPGSGVIIMPPVYPPFFDLIPEAGHRVVEVPLLPELRMDLAGIEQALADGARAVLLCQPHNPLGFVHSRADLAALADLAAAHDAVVVSDEIHSPLVHHGVEFTPYLAASEAAARTGVGITAASKGWNVAGLKCAVFVATDPRMNERLDRMPEEVMWRTSIFGLHASIAAFASSVEWLDAEIDAIVANKELLGRLLAEQLPEVGYRAPEAGYLAWLDFRALGWGDDPAAKILDEARVALKSGPDFGGPGAGFVRLNLACSPEMLTQAVDRIARLR